MIAPLFAQGNVAPWSTYVVLGIIFIASALGSPRYGAMRALRQGGTR